MNVPRDLPAGPEALDHLEFLRDLTPYVFLSDAARGKRVLEIGVGSGHGCWMLRRAGAQSVTAVDLDAGKVARAVRLNAGQGGVSGVTADAQHLPFRESCFDLVTCFEVIEHVPHPERLLSGIRHSLRGDGVALLSTPNRKNRLLPFQKPWNSEHRFEYRLSGFRRAVQRHFESPQFLGVVGEPESQALFLDLWRQKPVRVYARMLGRPIFRLLPDGLRGRLRKNVNRTPRPAARRLEEASRHGRPGVPEGSAWPFRVTAGELRAALNFVSVCGVATSVARVVQSARLS